jgi:hypothetical protein
VTVLADATEGATLTGTVLVADDDADIVRFVEAEVDLDEADDVGVVVGHQHGPGQRGSFRRACQYGHSSHRE